MKGKFRTVYEAHAEPGGERNSESHQTDPHRSVGGNDPDVFHITCLFDLSVAAANSGHTCEKLRCGDTIRHVFRYQCMHKPLLDAWNLEDNGSLTMMSSIHQHEYSPSMVGLCERCPFWRCHALCKGTTPNAPNWMGLYCGSPRDDGKTY